jgi:predicted nucleic acid-binding protein
MAPPPVLVDTGPLVAWFDRGDAAHGRCRTFFAAVGRPLVTTWPVLTEVCHLVPGHVCVPFMGFVAQGGIAVDRMDVGAAVDIAAMMAKYADVPMDLADASLVWLAGSLRVSEVATLDRADFGIYRLPGGKRLTNLLA